MKTKSIKAALMMAIIASTGAITLAAGSGHDQLRHQVSTGNPLPHDVQDKKETAFYRWFKNQLGMSEFSSSAYPQSRAVLRLQLDETGKPVIADIQSDNALLSDELNNYIMQMQFPQDFAGKNFHFAIRFHEKTNSQITI
jgi:hypothetical protein